MVIPKTLIIIFILFYSTTSAQEIINRQQNDSLLIIDYYQIQDSSDLYFPNKFFIDTINSFGQERTREFYEIRMQGGWYRNSLYSEQIKMLKEPILFNLPNQESYRFIWFGYLKSSHNPISLRLKKNDEDIRLYVKYISSGEKQNEPIFNSDTIIVSKNSWNSIISKIDSIEFWNISPIEKTNIVSMDGSVWIFEGKKDNKYHMVHRQNGYNKEIGELCRLLLRLSKLNIKKKEIY